MLTYAAPSDAALAGWYHGRLIIRFLRLRNAKLPLTVFLLVGIDQGVSPVTLAVGTVLIVLVYGFVVVFNDIHDVVGDRINKRDLPLATGELADAQAVGILSSLALAILLLLLAWGNAVVAMATAALTMASFLYSAPPWRLSDRGISGPALLAVCYVGMPVAMTVAVTGANPVAAIGVLAAAVPFALATSLFKDFGEERGDTAIGKLTPAVRHGSSTVYRWALASQFVGVVLGTVVLGPGWWLGYSLLGLTATGLMMQGTPSAVAQRYVTTVTIGLMAVQGLG